MTLEPSTITIPAGLLPVDGRFGCGPSKVRGEQVDALVDAKNGPLGTSHRKPPVKNLVGAVQAKLATLFDLDPEWEILLGNGGSTVFWDIATFGLVENRSQHLVFGEFSAKFAAACTAAPHLETPTLIESDPGDHPDPVGEPGVDVYALTHNETSTGVAMAPVRPAASEPDSLVVVDATSAAGGLTWQIGEVDVYYFAPQKCFGSDGGLWIAACSPAAVARIEKIGAGNRWRPASLDLAIALANSRKNQTYNTPAIATLVMFDAQLDWMLAGGGLGFAAARSAESAGILYSWAETRPWARPFVDDPAKRSNVVGTIDIDEQLDTSDINAVLRANGVVDTDGYRKLGRNQLRVGMFPAIDPSDVEALTHCVDYAVERLG